MAHNITPFKYITCTKNYLIMQLLSWHTTLHRLNTSLVQGTIQLCNCYHGTQHRLHRLNTSLVQGTKYASLLNTTELFNYAIVIMAHNITPFKYITCTKNYSIMQLLSWHTTLYTV